MIFKNRELRAQFNLGTLNEKFVEFRLLMKNWKLCFIKQWLRMNMELLNP